MEPLLLSGDFTDEEIEARRSELISHLESSYTVACFGVWKDANACLPTLDRDEMRRVACKAKGSAAAVAEWIERLGGPTPLLQMLEQLFGEAADRIREAVNSTSEESDDPGDWWRHAEGAPD